jgi:hypothetical protein
VYNLTEQLARVRARFAGALDAKIGDSFAALEKISGGGETIEVVIIAHRRLHELCGIAPTLGFMATGNAARSAETVMREAARCQSALDRDPVSASKRDPFERRVLPVALAPSELTGVAATERARACA